MLGMALAAVAGPAGAEDQASGIEVVRELTPYYTSLALYVPFDKPIPDSTGEDEFEIYRQLLAHSLKPQVLMLEASVYPMPVLGTWLRRNHPGGYADGELSGDVNWIESVTAGFREPGALSIFLGSAMNLVREGEERRGTNKAHVGYLLSGGTRHIRDNVLVDDDWYEFEWKIKGERQFKDDRLSWSFRIGTQQHANPEVADQAYVGIKRSNSDWRQRRFLSWLTNSAVSLKVGVTDEDFSLAGGELLLQKRYPLAWGRVAIALETGLIYENHRAYSGSLSDPEGGDVLFVLRPNLEF
jgi:hypothetical protein